MRQTLTKGRQQLSSNETITRIYGRYHTTPTCITSTPTHSKHIGDYSLAFHNKRFITTPIQRQVHNSFKALNHNNNNNNRTKNCSIGIISNPSSNNINNFYIYQNSRSFAKFKFQTPSEYIKQKRREFIPPMEDRNLERSITWKTKIAGLSLLSFSGFMYWWTCHNVCFTILFYANCPCAKRTMNCMFFCFVLFCFVFEDSLWEKKKKKQKDCVKHNVTLKQLYKELHRLFEF